MNRLLSRLLDRIVGLATRAGKALASRMEYQLADAEGRAAIRADQRRAWEQDTRYEEAKRAWTAGTPYYRAVTLDCAGISGTEWRRLRVLRWEALDPSVRDAIMRLDGGPKRG